MMMNQEKEETDPTYEPEQENGVTGESSVFPRSTALNADTLRSICDCPLNGDLVDISGNNHDLSAGTTPEFVADPEDPSRKVLRVGLSDNGSIVELSPWIDLRGNGMVEVELYTGKQEKEKLDFYMGIKGLRTYVMIPDSVIWSNTWLRLQMELLDTGYVAKVIDPGSGFVIKEEKYTIPFIPFTGEGQTPFLTIGYGGWEGKKLKGYLKNFKVVTLSDSTYIMSNGGEYIMTHDDEKIILNNA